MNQITSFGSAPALDNLRLPDNRRIGDLEHSALYAALRTLGIPNFKPTAGRQENVAAYAAHLEAIADAAGREAISAWMATKRNI